MGSISISPFQLSNARQIKSVLVHNQWFSHNSHLAKCCWRSTISPCSRTENLFTATGCHAVHYEDTLRYFPTCKRTPKPSAHIGCIKFQVGSMLRHFFSNGKSADSVWWLGEKIFKLKENFTNLFPQ